MVSNAETARALMPNARPREIVGAFMRAPFRVSTRVELDPSKPMPRNERGELVLAEGGGGALTPQQAKELATEGATLAPGSVAVVNKVTPEQLLAIVVSLIATSKNASEACVRIRQEVAGWRFESTSGEKV